jgi:hypothetical protein
MRKETRTVPITVFITEDERAFSDEKEAQSWEMEIRDVSHFKVLYDPDS